MNFCADGETLLVKNLDKYVRALVEQGHYAEVVTNLTVTPMLDKFLSWPKDLLKRLEFKCSFHYLELKKQGKLELFAENVKKVWAAGASACVETTPSDELIPVIDEFKEFSLKHFGALPQITIARNDRTSAIEYLTKLPIEEYDKVWSPFKSNFWEFKKTIFGVRRHEFCYAGKWGMYIDLTTGDCNRCYESPVYGNVFENPEKPLPSSPIARCPIAHCYNGHSFLSLGYIPTLDTPGYGDLRNRVREDGSEWLQPELRDFFNTKLKDSNEQLSESEQKRVIFDSKIHALKSKTNLRVYQALKSIKKTFK